MLIAEATDSAAIVFLVDLLSGLSVIGITGLLYPLFVKEDKIVSLVYLVTKLVEGTLMVIGGLFFLFGNTDYRNDIYEYVHIYPFIVGAAFLYYLFYKTKLIPRFISIWGFIAVFFLSLVTVFKWFDYSNPILDATLILMITNELVMALWLIFKGLRKIEK